MSETTYERANRYAHMILRVSGMLERGEISNTEFVTFTRILVELAMREGE